MNELTTLQKALITIKKLKQKLQDINKTFDPIAIIGLSCRFPHVVNKESYWQLLNQGVNIITDLPDERWMLLKNSNEFNLRNKTHKYWGGFLENIADFDAYFFGISPREAIRMDPQQRLLLEVAYEAIEDAGLPIEALAGSNTGVFASLYSSHFGHLQKLDTDLDALYFPTGNAASIAANRLSYLFDLRGPSMVIDTACSSSLIAVHLACLNLQTKLCDLALVGAVNINLIPSINSILFKAKMLSPDGQCKTFDASADGYVQGEGVGVIVLKPLSKALLDKDRIYAVITGTAANQDGKTNGLTAPNGLQQEEVIKSAQRIAKVDPSDISYVECHGTGTFLGDPIEIQALGEVIGKNRDKQKPCWIGSVKTNIGHLEPAAGIASIIKVALALKYAKIPAHLNFLSPNPHIAFDKYNLRVPQKTLEWPNYGAHRVAGISGFGFGGSNAHIVMQDISDVENPVVLLQNEIKEELFTLSAKDPIALNHLINKWCSFLENNKFMNLAQLCYNTHVRRSHYFYRLAIIASTTMELYTNLCKLRDNPTISLENTFMNINNEQKKSSVDIDTAELQKTDLPTLANLYTHQTNIDWIKYEEARNYPYIDMPLYAWQHKKYWPMLDNNETNMKIDPYPLQAKIINSPLHTIQFEFLFDTKIMPEIQDTFNVLHAGYYVEMLAFAVNTLYQKISFSAENIEFLSPLLVLPESVVKVQLIFDVSENNVITFSFFSNTNEQKNWIEHAKGKLSINILENKEIDAIETIKSRCSSAGSAELFYNKITGMGMPSGDTIRWTQQYWLGDKEILCEFREPKPAEKSEQFQLKIHLGIIDGCIQSLFMLLPDKIIKPYVASSMGKITYFGKQDSHMYLFATLKNIQSEGEKIYGSWYLVDKNNRLIAQCEDLCMTQLNNSMQIDQIIQIQSINIFDSSLPLAEQKQKIIQYLSNQLESIFSMPKQDINIHQSLLNMGLDSLMALALMRVIETGFGVTYSLQQIMQGPSINEIAEYVLSIKKPLNTNENITQRKEHNPWIAYRQSNKHAKIRLFCFPYGGGGASIYREWQNYLPDTIEVCPIQLPGRENRLEEKPIDNIDTLVGLLAKNLQTEFDKPFAFFGHSFGSLIAFELTRYLRRHNLPLPLHLFMSAYPDPRLPTRSLDNLLAQLKSINLNLFDLDQRSLALLSDEQLNSLSIIFSENGIAEYSGDRMDKEVIKVLLPIFISDMNLVKSYHYYNEAPFDLPTTVFLGEQDAWVSYEDHLGWADHTQKRCDFHIFDSGHLFIKDAKNRKKILQYIGGVLINSADRSLVH